MVHFRFGLGADELTYGEPYHDRDEWQNRNPEHQTGTVGFGIVELDSLW